MSKTANRTVSLLLALVMALGCVTFVAADEPAYVNGTYDVTQVDYADADELFSAVACQSITVAEGKATAAIMFNISEEWVMDTVNDLDTGYAFVGDTAPQGTPTDISGVCLVQDLYDEGDAWVTVPVRVNTPFTLWVYMEDSRNNDERIWYPCSITLTAEVPAQAQPFNYTGGTVNFIKADGACMGMFAPQEGTTCVLSGDSVVIHYVPKNTTVYNAIHWGDIRDTLTADVAFAADGTFDITLPKTSCGKALPVAPIKKKDGKTTDAQYYLAIPEMLTVTNNTGMFKADAARLETEGGKTTLVVSLTGTTYHYLIPGTYEQAVALGDNHETWIEKTVNAAEKYEFRLPLAEGQTYVPVVSVSNTYYTKYLNGENPLARAFYPRQFVIDYEAKTLTVDDYAFTQTLTVTNNVKMFKVNAAALNTVGGPNSNNYAATLTLTMGSTSFDKAFVGRASAITENSKTIDMAEGNTFALPVKWVKEFGNPDTLESLLGDSFVVSFHSVSKDAWYERQFTVSETGGTLTIDEVPAERTDLTITNNTGMFKALTAWLETEGGNTTLVMSLSGSGYHELFKGTYEQAVANDAATDNWIHGATNANGKWEFRIPLAEGETYVPVVAISNDYYTKYLNGQNSLARAFYPRQFTIDYEAKTIVTGDYAYTQTLAVTNNVKMFKVNKTATLNTVGGPNSNNYAAELTLTMGSESFDRAFVGRASAITENSKTIDIGEGNTFALPVKWVKEFGNPDTLESLLGDSFVVSFHSVSKDAWYERQFTVSEADGTLTIDEAPAEAVTVEPGTHTLEKGVCYRFGEGTFTLSGDPTVYQGGQEFYVSATGTYTVTKGR